MDTIGYVVGSERPALAALALFSFERDSHDLFCKVVKSTQSAHGSICTVCPCHRQQQQRQSVALASFFFVSFLGIFAHRTLDTQSPYSVRYSRLCKALSRSTVSAQGRLVLPEKRVLQLLCPPPRGSHHNQLHRWHSAPTPVPLVYDTLIARMTVKRQLDGSEDHLPFKRIRGVFAHFPASLFRSGEYRFITSS